MTSKAQDIKGGRREGVFYQRVRERFSSYVYMPCTRYTRIPNKPRFGAVVLIRQGPHGKQGNVNWRSELLQRLQEVRRNCKTRNQLKFKRLLLRFERFQQRHYGMKLLAYTLINLRKFCGT
jgi:hypothetical protein